jgi:multiple sugar transport system ATP-binding protein
VKVDLVESLGADKYVYFSTAAWAAHSAQLDELAAESDAHENQFVARVPAESKAAIGQPIELALDTTKLVVFDADTGTNLTAAPSGTP